MREDRFPEPWRQPRPVAPHVFVDQTEVLLEPFGDRDELFNVDEEVGSFELGNDGRFSFPSERAQRDSVILSSRLGNQSKRPCMTRKERERVPSSRGVDS